MSLLGQANGGFTESSTAFRILHAGVRNSVGVLTDDAFTQVNPPLVNVLSTVSSNVDTRTLGVLSGSIAFTRPDDGPNSIGGPAEPGAPNKAFIKPLGLFLNSAGGNQAFENTPAAASGKNTYMSAQGTAASQLFETQALGASNGGVALAQGDSLTYVTGQDLISSRNGYLQPRVDGSDGVTSLDNAACAAQVANGQATSTTLGILKMPSDSAQPEIVFDQRV